MSKSKKKQILATGKTLFWKHGFRRVTVEEICTEANVGKMTFYKHFANKMELVKAIMEKLTDETLQRYEEIMNSNIPFTEKVELQLRMKMEDTAELSSEFLDDLLIHGDPELMQYMSDLSKRILTIVHNDYIDAQKRGEIRKDVKPEFIIYFLNHMYDMLKDEQLINMYKDPNELAMELTRFFFYGIVNRQAQKQ